MATKKTKNVGIKGTKLNNSMAQLVAGIVPGGQRTRGSLSPNAINAISSLMLQVRGEYLTLNYGLLTCLFNDARDEDSTLLREWAVTTFVAQGREVLSSL